jgi:hypothetical protein
MSDATTTVTSESTSHDRAAHVMEAARTWSRDKAEVAKRAARESPAGAVAVVGATALLAASLFGAGEVFVVGAVGYAAFHIVRKRRAARHEAAPRHDHQD